MSLSSSTSCKDASLSELVLGLLNSSVLVYGSAMLSLALDQIWVHHLIPLVIVMKSCYERGTQGCGRIYALV